MQKQILSKKQLAEKLGLWKREEIDYEYQKQFRFPLKIETIIGKEVIYEREKRN